MSRKTTKRKNSTRKENEEKVMLYLFKQKKNEKSNKSGSRS